MAWPVSVNCERGERLCVFRVSSGQRCRTVRGIRIGCAAALTETKAGLPTSPTYCWHLCYSLNTCRRGPIFPFPSNIWHNPVVMDVNSTSEELHKQYFQTKIKWHTTIFLVS